MTPPVHTPETEATIRQIVGHGPPLVTAIHPDDEMFRFIEAHFGKHQNAEGHYYLSGAAMLQSLEDLLWDVDVDLAGVESFLEFACGYGRFTRHLIRQLDPSRVTGADLFKAAVDFQKATFGVHGFYSERRPEDLAIPGTYDVIFVASLFSHLPERVWGAWIATLYGALAEDGLLIFSTHGESSLPPGVVLPDSGFLFVPLSESAIHPVDEYGTTYVSSAYVHHAVQRETGQPVLRERVKGLFELQDVFVVRKPSGGSVDAGASGAGRIAGRSRETSAREAKAYRVLRRYARGLERTDAFFDPLHYLLMYPDVAASGLDPWQHYLEHGRKEGRMGAYVMKGLL